MKKLLFLLCMFLLSQCKQKPVESKLNNSSFTEGEVIHYQYDDSGRLVKESRKWYLLTGNLPDSISYVTTYFYDGKGRKIKIEDHDSSDELLSTTFFNYDSRDSLLAEYMIDNHGDTTMLVENTYGENGNLRLKKYRQLLYNQSKEDILNDKSNFDTLFTLTENFYQSGLLTRSTDRDSKNTLVTEREYDYERQRLAKMRVFEFPDSKKQLLIANLYFQQSNASKLERVSLNILGDTVGIKQIERNGKMAKITEVDKEMGHIFITNLNDKGQVKIELEIMKAIGEKKTRFFTYDSSGRKVKVVSRDQPLSEQKKSML